MNSLSYERHSRLPEEEAAHMMIDQEADAKQNGILVPTVLCLKLLSRREENDIQLVELIFEASYLSLYRTFHKFVTSYIEENFWNEYGFQPCFKVFPILHC
jgi:hypothetical protein